MLCMFFEVSLKKIKRKIKNKLNDKLTRHSKKIKVLFFPYVSHNKFLNAFSSLKVEKEIINHFRTRISPEFFFSSDNFPSARPEIIKKIIKSADNLCDHKFDLLGSGKINLGKDINGQCDFKNGFIWDNKKYYKDIEIVNLENKADIKVPWELSRFQHLLTLGKAYLYSNKNNKYSKEFVEQITDWIAENPPCFGVNWACTMDVAIRAVNWIWGFCFFKDSENITDEFLLNFLKSIYCHGEFIMENLEWSDKYSSNHYLSNIVGLLHIGVMFPEFKKSSKWWKIGLRELFVEMEKQVGTDGADYESSLSYHRLVLEMFLSAIVLCRLNNIIIPEYIMNHLEKMFEFVMYYTKPDGTVPQIGDNDNGRLHRLSSFSNSQQEFFDHRYLLGIGAKLFNRSDFLEASDSRIEEAAWLTGKIETVNTKRVNSVKLKSKCFPDAGIYIMRNKSLYMIISAGKVGTNGIGNHKHNDIFSFELFAYDKSFIVDPGTYIYSGDPAMRNLFRSTAYHNTVAIDDTEINHFDKNILFQMREDAKPKIIKWKTKDNFDFFEGEHYGYKKLKSPVLHKRFIYFDKIKGFWIIKDKFEGAGEHKFEQFFHFAPMDMGTINDGSDYVAKISDIESSLIDKSKAAIKKSLILQSKNRNGSNIIVAPMYTRGLSIEISQGWVSYSYGKKDEAKIVKYSLKSKLPVELLTIIYPGV